MPTSHTHTRICICICMCMNTEGEPTPRGEMRYILTLAGVVARAAGASGVVGRVKRAGSEPSRVTKPRALW